MSSADNFKVIIAGGGIAGLSLAIMLERFDLDYVVLEGHSDIAPAVGASIGMFPNGLRILDQIGCYKPIEPIFGDEVPYKKTYSRDESGNITSTVSDLFAHLETRHGYGLFFFDRQRLLEILYESVRHQERILLSKRVTAANLTNGGVDVTCADGSVFSGTILIGADGVHSRVRDAMTALGNKLQPGYFDPKEADSVPCFYKCSFGIAQNVPNWVYGEQHMVSGKGRSQLVISGPDKKVYWFMFEQLPEPKYGKDIPNYTKEDEAEFVKRNRHAPITRNITFGQVFDQRISSTLTPLHEMVYKKWFFARIMTIGDSTHKPNPIGGQGANGALETCAEFMNALLRTRDGRGGSLNGLTNEEIKGIFKQTQSARHERADMIIKRAHDQQALLAYENHALSSLVLGIMQPFAGDEATLSRMAGTFIPSSRLDMLPIPHRPRVSPFADEMPAKPIGGKVHSVVRNIFIGGMGLALLASTMVFRLSALELQPLVKSSMNLTWFGNNPVNDFFNAVVSVSAIAVLDQDPSARLHLWNFLPQLISPILVYTVEGYRAGQRESLLSLPSLFTVGMQVQGIGRMAPLHAIFSALYSHDNPAGRAVPQEAAKSLIPALTIGFLIPTILMLAPSPNRDAWYAWAWLWQFAAPLVSVLVCMISSGLKRWKHAHRTQEESIEESIADRYENRDVPALKTAYTYAFAVQATAHIASLVYGWNHPSISLSETFFALPNPFRTEWDLPTLAEKLAVFSRYDMALGVIGYLGSNLYSIWDLRRLGYIQTSEAVNAALSVVAGQFLVGSGATWSGLWYWREEKIASASRLE